jgi:hypothetical protein
MAVILSREFILGALSFLLTLMILSYLIGDNPAFRVAVYLFVGVSAGYAAAVAWWQVLWPRLIQPLLSGNLSNLLLFFPLLLGVLLLMKLSPRTARLGNASTAFLVGVGAAVAVGGALVGTLFPQVIATLSLPSISNIMSDIRTEGVYLERFLEGVVIILATVTTLAYFHFGAKATAGGPQRSKIVNVLSWIGQIFIAITFGVLFAAVLVSAITALIERWSSIGIFLLDAYARISGRR